MSEQKKPDHIVFNEDTGKYDAALKPYATSVGAPKITTTDTVAWKNRSINKANHKFKTKYQELKSAYQKMIDEFEYNQQIFDAKFSFEPIVGEIYHLYTSDNGDTFLSIIAPNQCNFEFIGSFYLDAEQIWQKVVEEM